MAAPATSGWRLGKSATTIVPGRAMAVDAWWRACKYRVLVLHLAPGEQLDILRQVDRHCRPLDDAEYVVLGDFNFQSGLHSNAERAKREEALTRQLNNTLARLDAEEVRTLGDHTFQSGGRVSWIDRAAIARSMHKCGDVAWSWDRARLPFAVEGGHHAMILKGTAEGRKQRKKRGPRGSGTFAPTTHR